MLVVVSLKSIAAKNNVGVMFRGANEQLLSMQNCDKTKTLSEQSLYTG